MVPPPRAAAGGEELRGGRGHVGGRVYYGRDVDQVPHHAGKHGPASVDTDCPVMWGDISRGLAQCRVSGPLQQGRDTPECQEAGQGETEALCQGPIRL